MTWLAIAIGGALGSTVRHAVNHVLHSHWLFTRFPVGTVVVNITGCFLVGLLAGLLASRRIALDFYWREFLFVGVLGGFTTFSTFGLDTFMLNRIHSTGFAILNVAVHIVGGLFVLWMGYRAGL
ncbi:MAG TPA: fluoride efflux transporter CrcB [Vicinamibacterales bacterium]|jgi:CrcB protein